MKVPKGWAIQRLEKVAEIQTGIAKGAHAALEMVSLPYLRVANVQDGHVNLSEMKEIEVPKEKVGRFLLQRGDLLMTEGGDFNKLGRGCIWQGQIDPCLHQNHVFAVRVTSPGLQNQFLAILAASSYGRRYFTGCSKQSTNLASINTSQLRAFPVLMPPLPEQRCIAEILDSWDRAIETQQKLLKAKTARLRILRHQLLTGTKRFPEFKEKWRTAAFGDFLTESRIPGKTGKTARKLTLKLYGKGLIPKSEDRVGSVNTVYYTRRACQFIYSKLDFLNGAFAVIPPALDGYETTADVPAFEINRSLVCAEWLLAYVVREEFYRTGVGYAAGGRKARRVNPDQFFSMPLKLPPLSEQTRIAAVLNACQREIDLLASQLEALRRQKRGLMQKLLTGEIRVAV